MQIQHGSRLLTEVSLFCGLLRMVSDVSSRARTGRGISFDWYGTAAPSRRLVRDGGTIKADLFSDHAEAVAASREWRRQIEDVHPQKADLDN